MDKTSREAWFGGSNIGPEAIERRKHINRSLFKFGCLPIIAIIVFIFIIAEFTNSSIGRKQYDDALQEFEAQKYESALELINEAISKDTANTNYYALRGKILYEIQDTVHNQEDFNRVLSLLPSDSLKILKIEEFIEWNLNHEDESKARELLEEEITIARKDSSEYFKVLRFAANKYLEIGDTIQAIELYNEISENEDSEGIYKNLIGILYHTTRQKVK